MSLKFFSYFFKEIKKQRKKIESIKYIEVTIDQLNDQKVVFELIKQYINDAEYIPFNHDESDTCFLCGNLDDPYLNIEGSNYNHDYKIEDGLKWHFISKIENVH